MHRNAGFCLQNFKHFPGFYPWTPVAVEGDPLHPPQHGRRRCAGALCATAPRCQTPNLHLQVTADTPQFPNPRYNPACLLGVELYIDV
jgi:hypothetical protein